MPRKISTDPSAGSIEHPSELVLPAPPRPPPVNRDAGDEKSKDDERMQGLREHAATDQKQAHAAKDDRGRDPASIRALQSRFADAKHDKAENGREIENVDREPVENCQRAEIAYDYVDCGYQRVQDLGVDGRVEEPCVIGDRAVKRVVGARADGEAYGVVDEAETAEERGEIALASSTVN